MESPELQLPNDEAVRAYQTIVRRHPHIGPRIEWFWGHREFPEFVRKLLLDTRDGTRAGFSWEVVKAFDVLQKVHDEAYPQYAVDWSDIWDKWCERHHEQK